MKANHVRQKLRAGQPSMGCFLGLGSPNVAELMGHAGFEWLVIETEHNGLDSAEVEQMLRAVSATDAIPIVRIPSANPIYIQRALDMGALGILVPMVRTAAEAQAIVSATRYPPQGKRSFGPLRAERYGFDRKDYFDRANDNIIVALILETKEAVQNLETIAAEPGIDALYLGPFDLCLSLGLNPMNQPFPEIEAVIDQMLSVGRKTGVAIGNGAGTPNQLRQLRSRGFTMLGYGPDYNLLATAARAGIAAFKAETYP